VDTATNISPERFEEGLTLTEYVRGMSKNRDTFIENRDNFTLRPEDAAALRGMGRRLKVLVLAEDWCGDVLLYLPTLACMAEAAPTWEVRVFYRDQNQDLSDLWLKDGKHRAIPVMVFFDEEMNEIACYVEKPAAVYASQGRTREMFAAEHPELVDASLPTQDMSDSTYDLYVSFAREMRSRSREQWQQWFVEEILAALK
jgi:hypothetical protein